MNGRKKSELYQSNRSKFNSQRVFLYLNFFYDTVLFGVEKNTSTVSGIICDVLLKGQTRPEQLPPNSF